MNWSRPARVLQVTLVALLCACAQKLHPAPPAAHFPDGATCPFVLRVKGGTLAALGEIPLHVQRNGDVVTAVGLSPFATRLFSITSSSRNVTDEGDLIPASSVSILSACGDILQDPYIRKIETDQFTVELVEPCEQ